MRLPLLLFACLLTVQLALTALPGHSQTTATIVNFDFNAGASYDALTPAVAPGVTATASASDSFFSYSGIATGASAFTTNSTAGLAVGMTNSSGSNTRYFQFVLGGSSLSNYYGYKLYWQSFRPSTGASTFTVAYSLDGGTNFTNVTAVTNTAVSTYVEHLVDLSGLTVLNNKSSVVLRLLLSGATGTGPARIDNFQVQATSLLNPVPVLTALSPAGIAAGSNGFTLTLTGSDFSSGSVARFNGTDRPTTVVSTTQLRVAIPATDVQTAGAYPVTVFTPGPGGGTSGSLTFTVAPVVRWTGAGGNSSWFDARNWDSGAVPTTTDDVLLDHSTVAGRYTVQLLPAGATTVVTAPNVDIRSLTVNPAAGDSILLEIPALNNNPTPLKLTRNGATETALAIYDKGVVTNLSDAGPITLDATATPVFYLYNGGTYRHYTDRPHAALVQVLAAVAGTEAGNWEFRAKAQASNTPSLSGRTYPNLIFRNRLGASATSYGGSGSNVFTVRGNLVVGPGVTFAPDINNEVRIAGNITVQGNFRYQPSSSTNARLVLNGSNPQRISGTPWGPTTATTFVGSAVPVQLNNTSAVGVTLATPVTVNNVLQLVAGRLNTDAVNLLTLANQPTGGSDNSFINGPVARTANSAATLTFPLGRAGAFRPLTLSISSLNRATTFVASQTEGAAPAQPLAPELRRLNKTRYFTVTPEPAFAGAENFTGTITLSFGPDDYVTNPEASSLVIAKSNGSGWSNLGRSASTGTASNGAYVAGTVTSAPFSFFSQFTLASTDEAAAQNPLPVTLTSFRAGRTEAGVRLSWTTAQELNNARFEVERSPDGHRFAPVATLVGQGTSTAAHAYTWLDAAAPAGQLYYRLRQTDADGTSQYTGVLPVGPAAASLVLYPNPVQERLQFRVPATGAGFCVVNLLGQEVVRGRTQAGTNLVPVQHLPPGAYYLVLTSGNGVERCQFYKQ